MCIKPYIFFRGARARFERVRHKNSWRTHGALVADSWRTRGGLMVHSWRTRGAIVVHSWRTRGALVVHSWRTRGALVVHSWRTRGALKSCYFHRSLERTRGAFKIFWSEKNPKFF